MKIVFEILLLLYTVEKQILHKNYVYGIQKDVISVLRKSLKKIKKKNYSISLDGLTSDFIQTLQLKNGCNSLSSMSWTHSANGFWNVSGSRSVARVPVTPTAAKQEYINARLVVPWRKKGGLNAVSY